MEHPPLRHHLNFAGKKPHHLKFQNNIHKSPLDYARQPRTSQIPPHAHPLRQTSQIHPPQQPSIHLSILANKIADLQPRAGDGLDPPSRRRHPLPLTLPPRPCYPLPNQKQAKYINQYRTTLSGHPPEIPQHIFNPRSLAFQRRPRKTINLTLSFRRHLPDLQFLIRPHSRSR